MPTIKNQKYILALAILTASTVSISQEISYDYIQATYASVTIDTETTAGDLDGNGVGFSGLFSVAPSVAINVGYGTTNYDELLGIDIDTTSLTFGLTAHTSISSGTDVLGSFTVIKGNMEASNGINNIDDDDTGNIISVGLRHLVTDTFELEVEFSRTDIFDDTSNEFFIGGRLYASDKFSLAAGYAKGDDVDALLLNTRVDFK
jgi:hypothetical protein